MIGHALRFGSSSEMHPLHVYGFSFLSLDEKD